MSEIIAKVYESLQTFDPHFIKIYINDHAYDTNLYVGMAICSKIKNQIYFNRSTKEFRFFADIKDGNTYIVLDKILKLQIPEDINENVAIDFFKLGEVLQSDYLISLFTKRFKNDEYTKENIFIMIKYCKYIGYNNKILDFICENIDSINHNDLIDSIVEIGLDFAEQLIIHFNKNNKNPNDIIFSLANKCSAFIELVSYLSDEYIEIRNANQFFKAISTTNGQSSIVSIFKSLIDKTNEKDIRIVEVNQMNKSINSKNEELRRENDSLRQDNSKQYNEILKLKNENEKLKKDSSKLNEDIIKLNDEVTRLKRENLSRKDEIDQLTRQNKTKSSEIISLRSENSDRNDIIKKIGENLPKIKKINNMKLDKPAFQEVYRIIKEASDEGDLATIYYYYYKFKKQVVEPKMANLCVYITSAIRGHIELTKTFIEFGANKFATDGITGRTFIHFFAATGNIDAIKYFMQYNYDLDKPDNDGNTPLHLAVINNYYNIVEYFCHHQNIRYFYIHLLVNNDGENSIDIARRKGFDRIRELLESI
ncbi:hypothetical protein TVAG_013760 [Trichomonas vaginalis G3]|uniref:Ankyrin repeat domain-containing protein 54 n=1 Tax=Trichomonas vaginalis (strain ATCC PRA-98 / G3) TaxID=412133 RepID=A2DDD2_TRIV3|nr:ankyrin repeat domain-containing protein 61 family [Trichomonas vaginalis G3]EAY21611.1 hypothetical protein TVAG_013760 [Trichomonas vaginalis G3]KAI5489713.1 ankyrin repeat domain-containing protein 61 family [Trichomonas vaginalis G3]|eukprot:XP_001582597.1 hypothetical protein [Trichomonas vaginalis G3]